MKKKKINKAIERLNKSAHQTYNYMDVFVYLINTNEIIKISEGTGDNLLREDREAGYVDYIYYSFYDMDDEFYEYDGGEILLEEYFKDKYACTAACIDDVMKFIEYDGKYIILSQFYYKKDEWYTETWTDYDIAYALSDNGISVTRLNINETREKAKHLFDDKSYRNAMLSDLVVQLFAVEN